VSLFAFVQPQFNPTKKGVRSDDLTPSPTWWELLDYSSASRFRDPGMGG